MSVNIYFKNHYMLIDKYILLFPQPFVKGSFRDMGVKNWANRILKLDIFSSYFCRKGCFLSFEWLNCNFATFGPCKNMFDPPLENPLLALP